MTMRLFVLSITLIFSQASFSQESSAPWQQPEVRRAAAAIDLQADQVPPFRDAVATLISNHRKAINQLLRRDNVPNLQRRIRTATNRQFRKMDQRMAALLTAEQYPNYQIYRDLLRANMAHEVPSNNTELGATATALEQQRQHH